MKYLFVVFFLIGFSVFADQQYKTHRVSRGETVESIAREYNVPVSAIYKLNPDAANGIQPSTTLIIPPRKVVAEDPSMSFIEHKVKRKETLYSLSKEYNVSIEDIKRYNKHLYAEPLKKGSILKIPEKPALSETSPAITQAEEPLEEVDTREHIVLPKETKYGISREYGITVEELEDMNPWVDTLQPGMMLKIKLKEEQPTFKDTANFRLYRVQPKETLYSLIRDNEISRDSLFNLNPQLKDGLKAGMLLKLPKDENELLQANHASKVENLENLIQYRNPKNLVLMLPFNLDKVEIDSIDLAKKRIQNDKVLQVALDFYTGVLMAVDSAKSRGISVNLDVLDTQQDPSHVNYLLNSNDFENVDAVIGPLLQETSETAARQLRYQGVPVISPLSTQEVRFLDNFVQTRPNKEMMQNAMLQYIAKNAEGKNIVIIAENSAAKVRNELMQVLENEKVITPEAGAVERQVLLENLDKNKLNWVILETNSIGLLSSLTSFLNSINEEYPITLFTTDKNKAYDDPSISNTHLGKLNFHFPSVDKEYDAEKNKDFINAYKKAYGLNPNQYAVRGFDITYDTLLRLAAFGSVYNSFETFDGITEYAENKFHYNKKEDGGYYNNAMYIIKYDKDLNRNVVR